MLAGAADKGSDGKTYRIKFDNAFGLVKGGDFRVGGVNAGQTTGFEVEKKQGESPKAVVTVEVIEAGLRRLPQGRELRDPAAVADRRVLRGLPARQVGRAAAGRRRRARGADLLDDPDGHRQRHHAPALPRALPADHHRARHRPGGAPGRPPGGAAARAPGPARDLEGAAHPRRPERGHQELHHGLGHRDQRAREEQARRRALGAARRATPPRSRRPAATSCARTSSRFPEFLDELRPTMARLGELADEQTPLLADLQRAAPDLDTFFTRVGPFSEASRPAVRSLGEAGEVGTKAFTRGPPGDRRAAHARRRGAAVREAAAPVPPDDRRPQARDRERPAREGHRAARAGPDRHPEPGRLHGHGGDLELLLLADAQHQHAGRHGAHAARVAHGRAGLHRVAQRAAEDAGGPGDVQALQLVPRPEPAGHLQPRPTRRRLQPVGRAAARRERQAGVERRRAARRGPARGRARCPASPTSRSRRSCSRPASRTCSTR